MWLTERRRYPHHTKPSSGDGAPIRQSRRDCHGHQLTVPERSTTSRPPPGLVGNATVFLIRICRSPGPFLTSKLNHAGACLPPDANAYCARSPVASARGTTSILLSVQGSPRLFTSAQRMPESIAKWAVAFEGPALPRRYRYGGHTRNHRPCRSSL